MKHTLILPVALAAASTMPLAAQLVGTETFTYADGPVANQAGGTGFNYDNFDKAVTAFPSDWDAAFGVPAVAGNALTTSNSGAKREYNGTVEGAGGGANDGQDNHERNGAVRGTDRVFYRFTITRGTGTTWSGASSFDFGTERPFFGVPGGNGPITGGLEFGCSGNGINYFTGIPADTATHTIVTVLDFTHNYIGMWLDPGATDFYDPLNGSNSADAGGPYTPDNWSTAVRLASSAGGTTTWDDLSVALDPVNAGLKAYQDLDNDGLTAAWELLHNLDDNDDGTVGETTPGAKNGPNGAAGDPDGDTLSNLTEFQDGTFPEIADSDNDALEDNREKALGTLPLNPDSDQDHLTDGEEVDVYFTNPLLPDSDTGGTFDFTELALGTLPAATPGDDPDSNGNLELVGQEFFDTYGDGQINNVQDGVGWDYDNTALGETFLGHTTLKSTWTNAFGVPQVQAGVLITLNGGIRRPFHGGSAVATAALGERTGAWREDAAATGVNGSDVLYLKVNTFRQPNADWSGMSLFNFGAEKIFVGVPSAVNPVSGAREFGIEQSAGALRAFSGISPAAETTYTLVARYDFVASRVDLWVNPNLAAPEGSSTIAATLNIAPAEMNATALRLASGGTGATGWDRLVAGTSWDSLDSLPSDSDGDGMPDDFEDLFGFDNDFNDSGLDGDVDGSTNLAEYLAGTSPANEDTDGDGLSDGTREAAAGTSPLNPDTDGDTLRDGDEVDTFLTDPTEVDTDNDGQKDGGEVQGYLNSTSDPLDEDDTVGAPIGLIGTEDFSYGDGTVGGLSGGAHFDYENWLLDGPFIGHTATPSDWDGTAAVAASRLVTRDTYAIREFNGPGEGPGNDGAPTGARLGAVNQEASHDASVVYFKTTMTRRAGALLSLVGPDDFDFERLAFGIVDGGSGPQWGIRVEAAVTTDAGALPVQADQTYTVVGKLDFDGNLLSLWVDPNLTGAEGSNAPLVTMAYPGANWASGVRLSSTGTGDTEWDDVVVANSWQKLIGEPGLPIKLAATYNKAAGTLSITATGIPEGTFHLRSSTDLQSFVPLVPAIQFDSSTPQPFVIPVDPNTVPKRFFRVEEGASPP